MRWTGNIGEHSALLARASLANDSRSTDAGYRADVCVFADDGTPLLELTGLTFARLATHAHKRDRDLFEVTWEPQPLVATPPGKKEQDRASRSGAWSILAASHGIGVALAARFGDVVHLWEGNASGQRDDNSPADAIVQSCLAAVRLVQTTSSRAGGPSRRLFIVTAGAQSVLDPDVPAVDQAPLWGLGRVIANEHPELHCTLIDLAANTADDLELLLRELDADSGDDQVAFRGGVRYVPRVMAARTHSAGRRHATATAAAGRPFRVDIDTPGILDALVLNPAARQAPARGELEIEVDATGLNFMNVMSALGIYPGYPNGVGPLGIECAGRVTAIGADTSGFRVGDAVLAVAFDEVFAHTLSWTRASCAARRTACRRQMPPRFPSRS